MLEAVVLWTVSNIQCGIEWMDWVALATELECDVHLVFARYNPYPADVFNVHEFCPFESAVYRI